MAASTLPKRADAHIPHCKDQGMPYLPAAGKAGVAVQHATAVSMPADGILTFAAMGFQPMLAGYTVIAQNYSDATKPPVAAAADRLPETLTVTGPDTGNLLDVVIFGTLRGQLR